MKPREKLSHYWAARLEWRELVAVMLWSWVKGISIYTLAKKVHKVLEQKKEHITIQDLEQIAGIWPIKAMQLISAFELAKRYYIKETPRITSIDDLLPHIQEYRNKKQEYLVSLSLDGAHRLIQKRVITIGLLNQSLVHPREVFADIIADRANSIILVHNHPSWTITPSHEDRTVTKRLQRCAELLGITLLDHVIVTSKEHYSFAQHNLL